MYIKTFIFVFFLSEKKKEKKLNTDSMLINAWLSGFIEADGHFSLRSK